MRSSRWEGFEKIKRNSPRDGKHRLDSFRAKCEFVAIRRLSEGFAATSLDENGSFMATTRASRSAFIARFGLNEETHMRIKTVKILLGGLMLVFSGTGLIARAHAQELNWAEKMFEKRDHDFGVVARGADAKYRLKVTNKYQEAVHIASVTTTCGCTAAKPSKDTLASRESAYIEIVMDTRKFTHDKSSSVTVVVDKPLYAEVRIPIHAYIRTDIVLSPGGAEFGPITKGTDETRKIGIAYAGRGNWKIKDVISKNPNVTAKLVETRRDATNVNYDLSVVVKGSTPLGELRDLLTLVTDDAGNPYIPVLVEGRVEPEFVVSDVIAFGNLVPGEKKTMNVMVRGKNPFLIEKIESEKTSAVFEVRLPKEAKKVHVVPLTLVAPTEPGTLEDEFTVTIQGSGEHVTFKARGKIVSQTGTASAQASGGTGSTTAQSNNK
jgi:hypothetical protein